MPKEVRGHIEVHTGETFSDEEVEEMEEAFGDFFTAMTTWKEHVTAKLHEKFPESEVHVSWNAFDADE